MGQVRQADYPFALQLTYLRSLDGEKIAGRAIKEIRGQGFADEVTLATWHTQLRQLFPDVHKGDTLTGVFTQDGQTIFFSHGEKIGQINDPRFSEHFFAIWLSPKTSAPEIRLGLLGQDTMKGHKAHEIPERSNSYGGASIY